MLAQYLAKLAFFENRIDFRNYGISARIARDLLGMRSNVKVKVHIAHTGLLNVHVANFQYLGVVSAADASLIGH